MTLNFKHATRENVSLLVGLAGASGSGKTYTAMRLASGIAGDKRFAVIDTENGRACHYADQFEFDVLELREPFTPESYADAIKAADNGGYPAIVVDSASHEYAGAGGILDMQEAEFERMGGRDSAKMASWVKPKSAHKRMMQRLLQTKAHLILCFRAEAKIEMVKKDGRLVVQPKQSLIGLDGWVPVTEKTVPFELTVSLLLTPDRPGIPHPIKLQEQHKALFPLDAPITEESGKRLAQWASGASTKSAAALGGAPEPSIQASQDTGGASAADLITPDQATELEAWATSIGAVKKFKSKFGERYSNIPAADYLDAKTWLQAAQDYIKAQS